MVRPNPDLPPSNGGEDSVPTFNDPEAMYLHSACHIQHPTWSAINPRTGTLTVLCAKCRKVVAAFKIEGRLP